MKADRRLLVLLARLRRHRVALSVAGMAAVVAIAGWAIADMLGSLTLAEVLQAFGAIGWHQFALCLALTGLSYFTLTFYDVLALAAMGQRQPYWRAALGSFSAYCFSHNFGFAPVTGGAARWRAYAGSGLSAADIARIVVLAGVTFWLGIFLMLGVVLVAVPGALRVETATLPYPLQAAVGAAVLALIAAYLLLCLRRAGPIRLLGWHLPVPRFGQALAQFALAATDITIASAALLVLLPGNHWAMFPDFVVAYVVAMVVALITHAPGGIGVFEAVILFTLPDVDRAALVSALVVYRVAYYWLPLLASILLLGGREALAFGKTPFRLDHGADEAAGRNPP
ncbi:lysylphosphatidylglycerol synthase domain-containing protein [Thermaurantiacus sp.]